MEKRTEEESVDVFHDFSSDSGSDNESISFSSDEELLNLLGENSNTATANVKKNDSSAKEQKWTGNSKDLVEKDEPLVNKDDDIKDVKLHGVENEEHGEDATGADQLLNQIDKIFSDSFLSPNFKGNGDEEEQVIVGETHAKASAGEITCNNTEENNKEQVTHQDSNTTVHKPFDENESDLSNKRNTNKETHISEHELKKGESNKKQTHKNEMLTTHGDDVFEDFEIDDEASRSENRKYDELPDNLQVSVVITDLDKSTLKRIFTEISEDNAETHYSAARSFIERTSLYPHVITFKDLNYFRDVFKDTLFDSDRFFLLINDLLQLFISQFEVLNDICSNIQEKVEVFFCLMDPQLRYFSNKRIENWNGKINQILQLLREKRQERMWRSAIEAQQRARHGLISSIANDSPVKRSAHPNAIRTRKVVPKVSSRPIPFSNVRRRKSTFHNGPSKQPEEELPSFKPTINDNSNWFMATENFNERMTRDICERIKRAREKSMKKLQVENRKLEHEVVVAKGSEKILKANGTWTRDLTSSIQRLHGAKQNFLQEMSIKFEKSINIDTETGQKLFYPVINTRSRNFFQKEAMIGGEKVNISDALYSNAIERMRRQEMKAMELEIGINKQSNKQKVNLLSKKYLKRRLHRDVASIFHSICREDEQLLDITQLLLLFQKVGLFPSNENLNIDIGGNERGLILSVWELIKSEDGTGVSLQNITNLVVFVVFGNKNTTSSIQRSFNITEELDQNLFEEVVEQLRWNYKARPKACETFIGSDDIKKEEMTSKTSKVRKNSNQIEYSIHGKPILLDEKHDNATYRSIKALKKVDLLRKQQEEVAMSECTFKPVINSPSLDNANRKNNAFERLYDIAMKHSDSVSDQSSNEFTQFSDGTSSPLTNKSAEERLHQFQQKLKCSSVPTGFYQKVKELRKGYEDRKAKNKILDAPFSPKMNTLLYRSKDGSTITKPFQLATSERNKNKQIKKMHKAKPDQYKLNQVDGTYRRRKQFSNNHDFGYDARVDEVSLHNKNTRSPLIYVTVHIGHNRKKRIAIMDDDDPREVAELFSLENKLGYSEQAVLFELLQRQIIEAKEACKSSILGDNSSDPIRTNCEHSMLGETKTVNGGDNIDEFRQPQCTSRSTKKFVDTSDFSPIHSHTTTWDECEQIEIC